MGLITQAGPHLHDQVLDHVVLVTVATFAEPWKAHILRGRLEAEGIFAVVIHENHVGMMWPYAMALGEIKVQVIHDELPLAHDVERRCRAGEYRQELLELFGDLDDVACRIANRSR